MASRRAANRVLAGALVILTGIAAYTSVMVTRQQNAPSGASRYNVTWLVSQAGVELARLQATLGGALLPVPANTLDDVQLRLDILENRSHLLEAGDVQVFIHSDPELEQIIAQLHAAIDLGQAMLDKPAPATSFYQMYMLFSPLNARMARLASAANIRSGDHVARVQEDLSYLYELFEVVLLGMALCGVGMIISLRRQNGDLQRARGAAEDLAENLRHAGDRLDAALSNMSQGLCMADANQRIVVCNRRFAEMFGLSAGAIGIGTGVSSLFLSAARAGRFSEGLVMGVRAKQRELALHPQALSFSREGQDGMVLAVSHQPMAGGGWVATYEDATERKRTEDRLSHMARHDALTGLPNRTLFREHMDRVLPRVRRGSRIAVLCLDLDGFKRVNDTFGHPSGDELLRQVARRLKESTRDTDLVARLGGDEFAIIQEDTEPSIGPELLANRLVASLREPFDILGNVMEISTSIGVVVAEPSAASPDELLRNADIALYRAKATGRSTWCFFEPGMDAEILRRRVLEAELRRALVEGQFEVYYQPLIEARTHALTGVEALLRWHHPERGIVGPSGFIRMAEEIGLIRDLGAWVLNKACTDAMSWPSHVKIAVNLSSVQFVDGNLVHEVRHALAASGLPPDRLELEITETVLLEDNDATLGILHSLHDLGVRISMDDFGTGYSSLSYLRQFPFDKIKIDQSFVRDLEREKGSIEIVRAVVGLGKAMGMNVLAEGVETEEQRVILQVEGCDELQGYLFSNPLPAGKIPAIIANHLAPRPSLVPAPTLVVDNAGISAISAVEPASAGEPVGRSLGA